jgi:hypothetical protein
MPRIRDQINFEMPRVMDDMRFEMPRVMDSVRNSIDRLRLDIPGIRARAGRRVII